MFDSFFISLKRLFKVGVITASVGLFTLAILKAPETHQDIIRRYVGNKTVVLFSGRSGGTGFYVTNDKGVTYLLTNKHVCGLAAEQEGSRYLFSEDKAKKLRQSRIVRESSRHDLCVLEAPADASGLSLGKPLDIGANIAIVGHPSLYPLRISRGEYIGDSVIQLLTECKSGKLIFFPFKVDKREIKTLQESQTPNFCTLSIYSHQITAYSRGGSSGSPVVNFFGEVVGVLFAGNRGDQFDSYMVPLEEVDHFINKEL